MDPRDAKDIASAIERGLSDIGCGGKTVSEEAPVELIANALNRIALAIESIADAIGQQS